MISCMNRVTRSSWSGVKDCNSAMTFSTYAIRPVCPKKIAEFIRPPLAGSHSISSKRCMSPEEGPPSGGGPLRIGRIGFNRAVELRNVQYADLGHSTFCVAGVVLAGADFAFDLDVRALGESGRELAELPQRDAAMPGRVRSYSPVSRFFQLRLVAEAIHVNGR